MQALQTLSHHGTQKKYMAYQHKGTWLTWAPTPQMTISRTAYDVANINVTDFHANILDYQNKTRGTN